MLRNALATHSLMGWPSELISVQLAELSVSMCNGGVLQGVSRADTRRSPKRRAFFKLRSMFRRRNQYLRTQPSGCYLCVSCKTSTMSETTVGSSSSSSGIRAPSWWLNCRPQDPRNPDRTTTGGRHVEHQAASRREARGIRRGSGSGSHTQEQQALPG